MRLDQELTAAGYDGTPDSFKEKIVDIFHASHPNWTEDDLVCHPRDALHYCNYVRSAVQCPDLPDPVILKTLLNIRKSSGR